jgi:GNAT superfamily N-acetyltransferase
MDLLEYIPPADTDDSDDSFVSTPIVLRRPRGRFESRLVTSLLDLERVTSIRRAVFCDECGYDEDNEFDGNDLCAAHILLSIDSVPVACARIRFFAEFVLLERFSVLPAYRHSLAAQHLSRACLSYAAAKGYRRVFGVVRDRFVNFWLRQGAAVREDIGPMMLGKYQYFPVELPIPEKFGRGGSIANVEWLLSRESESFMPAPDGLRQAISEACASCAPSSNFVPSSSFAH